MRLAGHTLAVRRGIALLSVVALAAAAAVTLSQCRMVDERLTGINSTGLGAASNCFTQCAKAYNDSIRVESQLHVANVHACAGNETCLALEELRHEAAVNRIQTGRNQCQDNCHHQGSGTGGQ